MLRVAMHYMSTSFGVDSSSQFAFKAGTYRQTDSLIDKVIDTTDNRIQTPATASVSN